MPRKKLKRFQAIKEFNNVFETQEEISENILSTEKPIILELGCGKGDYTFHLAQRYPDSFFAGFDKKGERIWNGATRCQENNLTNTAFIRGDINLIDQLFPAQSVKELWITFPGPFPKDKHEKRRLTSQNFIQKYKKILKPDHTIHLKTDDLPLFEYTQEVINQDPTLTATTIQYDIHSSPYPNPDLDIQTDFEKKWIQKGKTINYLAFKIK